MCLALPKSEGKSPRSGEMMTQAEPKGSLRNCGISLSLAASSLAKREEFCYLLLGVSRTGF